MNPLNAPFINPLGFSSSFITISSVVPIDDKFFDAFNNVPVIFDTLLNPPPTTFDTKALAPLVNPNPNSSGPFNKPFLGSLNNWNKPVPNPSNKCKDCLIYLYLILLYIFGLKFDFYKRSLIFHLMN